MAGSSTITIRGRVGRDPAIRFMPDGKAVCDFSVAVKERKRTDAGWVDGDTGQSGDGTTWWRVTVWGEEAEAVTETVRKGVPVVVVGYPYADTYRGKEGDDRMTLEIRADWQGVGVVPTVQRPVGRGKEEDPWGS